MRIDTDAEDALIDALVSVAREYIEDFTGRSLLTQTWRLRLDCWPDVTRIALERTPLATVTHVKYYPADGGAQATLTAGTHYRVNTDAEPGFIELIDGQYWPDLATRSDAVEIVFTAGAASASSIPHGLMQALRLRVAELYEIRTTTNIGNIVNELPRFRNLLESKRVGGWVA